MIQRLALLLGSIAASAVLAVSLAAAGFAPAPSAAPTTAPAPAAVQQVAVEVPTPEPTTQVDTVYVKPAAPPKTIRIIKTAPTKAPVVIHKIVRSTAGRDGENESGNETESD